MSNKHMMKTNLLRTFARNQILRKPVRNFWKITEI